MMEHDRLSDTFGDAVDDGNEQSEEFEYGYEEEEEEEEDEDSMEAVHEEVNFVDETSTEELVQEESRQEQSKPQQEQDDENLIKEEEVEEDASVEEQVEEDLSEAEVQEEVEEELIEERCQGKCMEELTKVHGEEEFHQEKFRERSNEITLGQDSRRGKSVLTMAQSSSEANNKECRSGQNHSYSSENKRKTDIEQVLARKKGKKEMSSEAISGSGPICTHHRDATKYGKDLHVKNIANENEKSGSSGKKRCSRWDYQSETGLSDDNIQVAKRRKTRWDIDDKQIKMLGPLQLPDFTGKLNVEGMCDVETQKLNKQLIEINNRLLEAVGPEEISSASPIYKELGIQTDRRKEKLRSKLIKRKQEIIAKLIQKNLLPITPKENKAPPRYQRKLYIPAKEFPGYNFIGLILGPCGSNQKRMEMESGARILLRGKGSVKEGNGIMKHNDYDDDLHVRIEADNQESLDTAVSMVEKLLVPVVEEQNELKKAQLQELAIIKGKSRSYISCLICGDTGHSTSSCPLTAPTGESRIDKNSTNLFGEIGGRGLFSHGISSDTEPVSSFSPNGTVINKEMDTANLFVGYLPQSIDETGLAQLFSSFGTIVSTKVIRNHATGVSKGYGFVRYDDPVSAVRAVEQMNRFQVEGKTLVVRVAGRPPSGTHHGSISPTLNPVGQLPTYPGHPNIPQSFPDMTGLTRPSVSILGSSSAFTRDGCFFTDTRHLMATPTPYATCAAPAVPCDFTDFFTPTEFANFAGNPDNFTSQFLPLQPKPQSTRFTSSMVSRNQVPTKAADCPSKADYPTSMYDFHQPKAGLASNGVPLAVEAAYFAGNPPDYNRNPFYQ